MRDKLCATRDDDDDDDGVDEGYDWKSGDDDDDASERRVGGFGGERRRDERDTRGKSCDFASQLFKSRRLGRVGERIDRDGAEATD